MSRTYSIACVQCQVHLWIAQGTPTKDEPLRSCHTYSTPAHIEDQRRFYFEHLDHPLVFAENTSGVLSDFKEVGHDAEDAPDADL